MPSGDVITAFSATATNKPFPYATEVQAPVGTEGALVHVPVGSVEYMTALVPTAINNPPSFVTDCQSPLGTDVA
jgi:hypothetical protein